MPPSRMPLFRVVQTLQQPLTRTYLVTAEDKAAAIQEVRHADGSLLPLSEVAGEPYGEYAYDASLMPDDKQGLDRSDFFVDHTEQLATILRLEGVDPDTAYADSTALAVLKSAVGAVLDDMQAEGLCDEPEEGDDAGDRTESP